MAENKNHYRENSFSLLQSLTYTLLIQFEVKSFSYAVVYNYRLMAHGENCPFYELNDPGELRDILTASYKKTIIGLPASALTLVPKNLVEIDKIPAFARFLDVQKNEKVLAQLLDDRNVIIYKTDDAIISKATRFGLQNTLYTAKGWINAIARSKPLMHKLYLDIGNDLVQFLYYSAGHLRFYNIFEINDEDDLAYFSILVAEQLNLNPKNTTLVISGNINEDDNKFFNLSTFFGGVELNEINIVELPWHIPSHKIMSHVALLLCAL